MGNVTLPLVAKDVLTTQTEGDFGSLAINKVSGSTVYYTLYLNPDYQVSSGFNIRVKVDGTVTDTIQITSTNDMKKAASSDGLSGSLSLRGNTTGTIQLYIEGAKYSGQAVDAYIDEVKTQITN